MSNFGIGFNEDSRVSSRVLKPPGGGHSNIFGPPEEIQRPTRSKNNQQNSDMMGEIMGKPTAEPQAERKQFEDAAPMQPEPKAPEPAAAQAADPRRTDNIINSGEAKEYTSTRGRVPPGGFSAGLW